MDTFGVGTRIALPLSLPFSSGKISIIAVAEPVLVGISELPRSMYSYVRLSIIDVQLRTLRSIMYSYVV